MMTTPSSAPTSVSSMMNRSNVPSQAPTPSGTIIVQNRLKIGTSMPPRLICQALVINTGTMISGTASLSPIAIVSTATAVRGRPSPTTPLVMPAARKAIATVAASARSSSIPCDRHDGHGAMVAHGRGSH